MSTAAETGGRKKAQVAVPCWRCAGQFHTLASENRTLRARASLHEEPPLLADVRKWIDYRHLMGYLTRDQEMLLADLLVDLGGGR